MKNLIVVLALLVGFTFTANSQCIQNFSINKNGVAEIDNPNYGDYQYKLTNKAFRSCNVKVVDRESGEFISGFGMGSRTSVVVNVPSNGKIVVTNDSKRNLKIKGVKLADKSPSVVSSFSSKSVVSYGKSSVAVVSDSDDDKDSKYIQFNLINNSNKDIALRIPSVMNPNLLPNSKSGVNLKLGQKIYFRAYGKNYELLEVSSDIAEGEDVIISRLLKEKKYELGFY